MTEVTSPASRRVPIALGLERERVVALLEQDDECPE